MALCEPLEQGKLFRLQWLSHQRQQDRPPACPRLASKRGTKQQRIGQRSP